MPLSSLPPHRQVGALKRDMDLQIAAFLREEGLERKHRMAVEELQVGGHSNRGGGAVRGGMQLTCPLLLQAECAALSRDKDRWHAEEVLARKVRRGREALAAHSGAQRRQGECSQQASSTSSRPAFFRPPLQQLSALKAQRDLKSRELAAISNDRKAAVELSKVKELTVGRMMGGEEGSMRGASLTHLPPAPPSARRPDQAARGCQRAPAHLRCHVGRGGEGCILLAAPPLLTLPPHRRQVRGGKERA